MEMKVLGTFLKLLTSVVEVHSFFFLIPNSHLNSFLSPLSPLSLFISQDMGPTLRPMHSQIATLVLNGIYRQKMMTSPAAYPLLPSLYRFFTAYLLNQWKYLIPAGGGGELNADVILIIEAYLLALTVSDVNAIKSVIGHLVSLHEKRSLLSAPFFSVHFRLLFIKSVLNLLLLRTYDLLRQDLVTLLFSLASSDFPSFYDQIFPAYVCELGHQHEVETSGLRFPFEANISTFRLNMDMFIADWQERERERGLK